jgi:predicted flap endonuclease-1-like 5' DNA nuclease
MPADMSASLPFILIGLALLVLAVWLLARLNRKAKVMEDGSAPALARDVLDEGAAPAQRNQALIDAAPAAAKEAPAPIPAPEPIAAPVPVPIAEAPVPAPAPAPAPTPAATASADDIARIKGVGPKLVALLGELGVTTFAQIAAWSDADVERIDAQLGRFKGRITRDQWIEQAKLLAAGEETAFINKYGING